MTLKHVYTSFYSSNEKEKSLIEPVIICDNLKANKKIKYSPAIETKIVT